MCALSLLRRIYYYYQHSPDLSRQVLFDFTNYSRDVLPGYRGVDTNRFDNNDWTYFERNNNIITAVVRKSASKHYHELVILCDLGRTTKDFIPRLCWVIYFETSRKNAHELYIVLIFAISVRTHSFSCPGNSVSTPHASSIVLQWKTNKRTLD